MASIRVVVQGVLGKMGLQVLSTLCDEDGLEPVGAVDLYADTNSITLPDGSGSVPLFTSVEGALVDADVVVDFTNADGALAVMREAAPAGVHVVIAPPATRTPPTKRQRLWPRSMARESSSPPTSRLALY